MEPTIKEIKYISNKPLKIITIVALLLIMALIIIQWVCVNNNIEKIKQNLNSPDNAKKDISSFYFNFTKTKDKQILLSPEEFKKMYEHVNALAEKVSEESKRTQEIINQDINRLNLYMAIGIGFISILGVFIPILVNILSFDDIKNKQKELESKQNLLDQKEIVLDEKFGNLDRKVNEIPLEEINNAIERSRQIVEVADKVQKLEAIIENSLPQVSVMIFQTSVIRYFYISPVLMCNLIREQDGKALVNLIESMRDGFTNCNKINTVNDPVFVKAIKDFILFISDTRFHSSFLNIEITNSYVELTRLLNRYINGENVLDSIIECFNTIIIYISEYAQVEPAIA